MVDGQRPTGNSPRRLASLLVFAAALSACGGAHPTRHNLILITLDTTRADRLGCYGAQSVATPNLDRVAASGTVFDSAFATAPITAPSHVSMLSGTFPPFHQVRDNDVAVVPDGVQWLPEVLSRHGFETAGIVAAQPLRAAMGFSRGFQYFGDQFEAPKGSLIITNLHTVGVVSRPGDRISEEFTLWLNDRRGSGPFFVWLHYYDPHWPWHGGRGYADLYVDAPYDGEIAFMDDCIGEVLQSLDRAGLGEDTGLVVIADHGEGLMDHGELTHAMLLYNSTLRVPFIVNLPWLDSQARRVDVPVSGADVMPTILDALGIDVEGPAGVVQGRSLLPLLAPSPPAGAVEPFRERRLYFETFYPFFHYRWSPLSGFIQGTTKYIHGPVDELYDLSGDPEELASLAESSELAEPATRLGELDSELRRGRPEVRRYLPSRDEQAKLQALGYLGSVATEDPETIDDRRALPNPNKEMETFFKYNDILGLIQRGRRADALEIAASIAAADPNQKDARLTVASLSAQLGRVESADRAFADLVDDFPDKDVLYKAGVYFQERGDLGFARQCFEQLVERDPRDVEAITALAEIAVSEDRLDEARRHFENALAQDPWFREAMLGLALLLDRQGDAEAAGRFAAVASRYPFDPLVHYDYGVYLLRNGEASRAVEHLRLTATVSRGPLFAAAQFALAAYFEQRGDIEQARACLREVVVNTDNPMALRRAQTGLEALANR